MKKIAISRVWLVLAFIAIYFIWGTTYLANLYALKALTPFIITALRYLTAGLALAVMAYLRKVRFPRGKISRNLAISGVIMLVGGSGLVVVAEQYISSGAAAVIVATEPLWFVLLDRPRWKFYFANKKIIAGLLIAFTGIVLFAHYMPSDSTYIGASHHQLLGIMIVLMGSVLWVVGTLFLSRKIEPSNYNLWHTTVQLIAGGAFSALIALVNGEWLGFSPRQVSLQAWGGLAFLIIFGSMVAYLSFAWLVTVQPPAIVSTHTYVNPLIAVFTGWIVVGEKVTTMQMIALTVALIGVLFTQIGKQRVEG